MAIVKITYIDCKYFNEDITRGWLLRPKILVNSMLISTDDSVPLVIWTFAEPAVIIMAASVPYFRLFIKEVSHETKRKPPGGTILRGDLQQLHLIPSRPNMGMDALGPMCTSLCRGGPMKSSSGLNIGDRAILRTYEFEVDIEQGAQRC